MSPHFLPHRPGPALHSPTLYGHRLQALAALVPYLSPPSQFPVLHEASPPTISFARFSRFFESSALLIRRFDRGAALVQLATTVRSAS